MPVRSQPLAASSSYGCEECISAIPPDAPLLPMYHPDFYFEDGNLTLLVENTLYRVFRSSFTRHSAVWKELFALPSPPGELPEGSGDAHPLVLYGILSIDFERLLSILYPVGYGVCGTRTVAEWTSILRLSARWEFNGIRTLAIREVQKLDMKPIDKIALAREFDISGRWAVAAYLALCRRPEALTLEEANCLGLEAVVRVAQLREQMHRHGRLSLGRHYQVPTVAATRRVDERRKVPSPDVKARCVVERTGYLPARPTYSHMGRVTKGPSAATSSDEYRMVAAALGLGADG